jgi:hypothetical protein
MLSCQTEEAALDMGFALWFTILVVPGLLLLLDWMLGQTDIAGESVTRNMGGYPAETYNDPEVTPSVRPLPPKM